MRSTSLSVLITFITLITACATADDVSTGESASALADPCTADKAEFKNYEAVAACAKSSPALFQLAVGAIVKAGGRCTAVDAARACTSIEPIEDDLTRGLIFWPIGCRIWDCPGDPVAGLGYCKAECCINGFSGPICVGTDRWPR